MMRRIIYHICITILVFSFSLAVFASATEPLFVRGDVNSELALSVDDITNMPPFHMNNVALIKEKSNPDDPEELISVANYRGVLLRDILQKAGMKYTRKWEPGVFIIVRDYENKEVSFSFGELFYSSIGRSVLLAYECNGQPLASSRGIGELIVATDLRDGRRLVGVKEIIVQRVDLEMKVYDDKTKNITRPPTTHVTLIDRKSSRTKKITIAELLRLRSVRIGGAVMIGDCEGFKGIHSFEGVPLRSLLEDIGVSWNAQSRSRYVLVSSEDGFCATFSLGEIFNSRLDDNIVLAYTKNGRLLDARDGFVMSVVREDGTAGRSVKRIHTIEVR